jgi:hypothetical protein
VPSTSILELDQVTAAPSSPYQTAAAVPDPAAVRVVADGMSRFINF